MEGTGVYWYSHQRAYCSAFKSWQSYINAAIDMFFAKDTLSASCAMGNEKKSKTGAGHQPLNPVIIQALIGKLHMYSRDSWRELKLLFGLKFSSTTVYCCPLATTLIESVPVQTFVKSRQEFSLIWSA